MPIRWQLAYAQHIGGREDQQDRVAILREPEERATLLVLADGMGGHRDGALAAQAVIDVADSHWQQYLADQLPVDPDFWLSTLLKDAHQEINRIDQEHYRHPGSACILLWLERQQAVWLHVGDCRLYHFRQGHLLHRTRDHSVVQMLVDLDEVSEEEMANHVDQGRLLASLGGDHLPRFKPRQERVQPSDGFLLCSDGLWETILVDEMIQALASTDLEMAARQLVTTAVERGGVQGDNVSVAMARVVNTHRPWYDLCVHAWHQLQLGRSADKP